MGNRAVIQIQGQETGVYLHWNGGYDTVKPLLDVAREYGVRGDDYGTARLAQMLGNFFCSDVAYAHLLEDVPRHPTFNRHLTLQTRAEMMAAMLAQMLGNFFGGILNVGVGSIDRLDCNNGDNGTYVVDTNFNIVDRLFYEGREANYHDYDEMRDAFKQANDRYFIKQEGS